MEAEAIPLPRDETTPPVTKMYFVTNILQKFFHRYVRHEQSKKKHILIFQKIKTKKINKKIEHIGIFLM